MNHCHFRSSVMRGVRTMFGFVTLASLFSLIGCNTQNTSINAPVSQPQTALDQTQTLLSEMQGDDALQDSPETPNDPDMVKKTWVDGTCTYTETVVHQMDLSAFEKKNELTVTDPDLKFSDIESSLPLPVIKAATIQDALKQLENTKNFECSYEEKNVDSYNIKFINCQYKDRDELDRLVSDYYVALQDSNYDNQTRIYLVAEANPDFNHDHSQHYNNLFDVHVRPFMDTNAVYVRIEHRAAAEFEHCCVFNNGTIEDNYYTFLFAGKKLRLVQSWLSATYEKTYEYSDHDETMAQIHAHRILMKHIQNIPQVLTKIN